MPVNPVIDRVSSAIQGRIDAAKAAGNDKLAQRWMRELGSLTDGPTTDVMTAIAFDPAAFERLAIYAAQKVRRMLGAFVGTGHVDPYRMALVKNAKHAGGSLSSSAMRATLDKSQPCTTALKIRRAGADTTAATQVSSTVEALEALGMAAVTKLGKERVITVNFEHPLAKVFA